MAVLQLQFTPSHAARTFGVMPAKAWTVVPTRKGTAAAPVSAVQAIVPSPTCCSI